MGGICGAGLRRASRTCTVVCWIGRPRGDCWSRHSLRRARRRTESSQNSHPVARNATRVERPWDKLQRKMMGMGAERPRDGARFASLDSRGGCRYVSGCWVVGIIYAIC